MTIKTVIIAASAIAMLGTAPAMAQSRWATQASEAKSRREENKDIRSIQEADKVSTSTAGK